jgi:glutaminyl-tRNA synthetase
MTSEGGRTPGLDFIRTMVEEDGRTGKYGGRVATRFPPEPNGYLHIGHAKSCCLNFGLGLEHGGTCNLRFDDTNPETEDMKYVEAIKRDVAWLGYDWDERLYHASDYFEQLYEWAELLIEKGLAYVDSLSEEEIREYRGTVTEAGRASPHRDRSPEENLDLFRRMKAGEFKDGEHVLRGKIDMAHPNMLMRDPVLYRLRHASHYRRGDEWCLYPLYDFTHCLSDAIENITHSLCTLEFKDNNELYEWVLDAVGLPKPRTEQTEFARLNLDYTVLSKRRLIKLVEEGFVSGWDDPRMPTIAGLRRRGVTPEAIRKFCDLVGVAKNESRVDIEKLEWAIRDDLNPRVPRVLCVLKPLKVVITNYPEGRVEELDAPYYPRDIPKEGSRPLPFSREIYIERDDFMEDPPRKFFRLAPGREVRLRYGYIIKCEEVIKDPKTGEVTELRCTYDPETKSGTPDGRKVKGTIHWVSAAHALPCEVRLYDRLFVKANPDAPEEGKEFTDYLNPESLVVLHESRIEPSVADDPPGTRYQFERQGYFISDEDSKPGALVFNRTVSLRDTWAKMGEDCGEGGARGQRAALVGPHQFERHIHRPQYVVRRERPPQRGLRSQGARDGQGITRPAALPASDSDHLDVGERLPGLCDELYLGPHRRDVHEHDVGYVRSAGTQTRTAVRLGHHLVAGSVQDRLQAVTDRLVVIHHQCAYDQVVRYGRAAMAVLAAHGPQGAAVADDGIALVQRSVAPGAGEGRAAAHQQLANARDLVP